MILSLTAVVLLAPLAAAAFCLALRSARWAESVNLLAALRLLIAVARLSLRRVLTLIKLLASQGAALAASTAAAPSRRGGSSFGASSPVATSES